MTTPLDALQIALAGEHAALYVYGVLGAQTSGVGHAPAVRAVSEAYATHRARRDHLTGLVLEEGGTPVASEAAYELPGRLGSPVAVSGRRGSWSAGCGDLRLAGGEHGGQDRRRWAIDALTDTAVRELTFRGSPEIFPGAHESADRLTDPGDQSGSARQWGESLPRAQSCNEHGAAPASARLIFLHCMNLQCVREGGSGPVGGPHLVRALVLARW